MHAPVAPARLRGPPFRAARFGTKLSRMNDTWSHAAARILVRPLVGTRVRPNHITVMRLLTGAVACVLLALGGRSAEFWCGVLWLISAFLDRADGELARVGLMQSRTGHVFDY